MSILDPGCPDIQTWQLDVSGDRCPDCDDVWPAASVPGHIDWHRNVPGCDEILDGDLAAAGRAVQSAMAEPCQLNPNYEVVGSAYATDDSAAAGLISSVMDLAKFEIALDEDRLSAPETKAEMPARAISTSGARPSGARTWGSCPGCRHPVVLTTSL